MYCSKCGKEIDEAAVVCIYCGVATQNMQKYSAQPLVVNNNTSASSSAAATVKGRVRRRHSLLLDIFMICITGGLWIIWMVLRPKYY